MVTKKDSKMTLRDDISEFEDTMRNIDGKGFGMTAGSTIINQ
jgi:hypothetical protein